jgi:probable rRNA maturation factor
LKIRIFYDEVKYRLKSSKEVLKLIEKVIRKEKRIPGDLNFIFTTDIEIININKEFLKHNYFTDVIAFENNKGKSVNGEIYLSIDTIRRNADNYKVSLRAEIIKVMIHGTLHLCGYADERKEDKEEMNNIENKWIKKYLGNEI